MKQPPRSAGPSRIHPAGQGFASHSPPMTTEFHAICMPIAGSSDPVISNSHVARRLCRKNWGIPIGYWCRSAKAMAVKTPRPPD